MELITIPVKEVIFKVGDSTIYVINKKAAIILRVDSTFPIEISELDCINSVCHADIHVANHIQASNTSNHFLKAAGEQYISISAAALEFDPIGRTIWVQDGKTGATILRIKATKGIKYVNRSTGSEESFEKTSQKKLKDFKFYLEVRAVISICLIEKISSKLPTEVIERYSKYTPNSRD